MNELKDFWLAKQGNAERLAFINNLLQPEGITATTDLKDGYLKNIAGIISNPKSANSCFIYW